jgi:tetratricopeptide (TPR) repeat protein
MTVDPSQSTTPFASIDVVSCYEAAEEEVLFSMHTVFRIQNIKPMDEKHRLFQVDLTLTSDKDKDLLQLTDHIRKDISPEHTGWYPLGHLLMKMGEFDKAQQVYEVLLGEATNEKQKAALYHQLGWAKYKQKDYDNSIIFYGKSLEILKKICPSNHLGLASLYNNIAVVFEDMREYSKALLTYKKALEIKQKSLPPDHLDLGRSYSNIGSFYSRIGQHAKALPYLEKDLEISLKALPSYHPDVALSYYNIGLLYENMNDYSKAHSFYEHAVNIAQRALPPNHPHLKMCRRNLEDIKKKL